MSLAWNWQDFRDWRTQLMAIALGTALLALLFQGNRGLWGADEGRYSNVALQMLESGDWLTPHRHPEHIEYSRPPMTYWVIAASVAVFGPEEWTLRLPGAVSFFLTTLIVFFLARRLCAKRAWLPPVIYATNFVPFLAANYISADSLLTLFETFSVWAFVSMWQAQNVAQARNFRRLMWLGFALAFMTKGPAALLPLLALAAFRRFSGLKFPTSMVGFDGPLVFLVLTLPWFIWMIGRGETSGIVAGNQALSAIRGSYRPLIEVAQGPWYGSLVVYGPILFSGLLPWGALALLLAATQYRRAISVYFARLRWQRFRQIHQESVFLLTWFLLPLIVLFVVQVRLWLYVLPLLVPMTLVFGRAMQFVVIRRWMAFVLLVWVLGMLWFKGIAPGIENKRDAREFAAVLAPFLPNGGANNAINVRQSESNVRKPADASTDIAFFETTPMYGLKFYLGNNLVRVAADQPRDASFDLRLAQVLVLGARAPLLWVTERSRLDEFVLSAAHLKYLPTVLARSDDFVVLQISPQPDAAKSKSL
jgi:4-amino-4-deoxy-L-arabinose transferase-like glycosyltransferase